MVAEGQRHRPGEVLDRGDLLEDLLQTRLPGDVLTRLESCLDASLPGGIAEQPVKALGLQREEVRNLEGSLIFAKEMRSGAVLAPLFVLVEALREAAKRGSFRGLGLTTRVPVPSDA